MAIELPTLHLRKRSITTPFGLIGNDENALSFALGYTFQQCPQLLQWFLGEVGISNVRISSIANARIDLQRNRSGDTGQSITDIEIHLPGKFHLIVEAKVGLAIPTLQQCQKYLPRFQKTNEPFRKLVSLVQSADTTLEARYSKLYKPLKECLKYFHWFQFIPKCVGLINGSKISGTSLQAVRWFHDFLDQEYSMKAFTTEVWILPVSTTPIWPNGLSFRDIHENYRIYLDTRSPTVRPLYIGFRFNGKLETLNRVLSIEHEVAVSKYVPDLESAWKDKPHTIWHLGKPIALPIPIPTGNQRMMARRVQCDFDLLLSCKSVFEIEKEMKIRGKRKQE